MLNILMSVIMISIILPFSLAAESNESSDNLGARVSNLESKMDQIIRLLENKSSKEKSTNVSSIQNLSTESKINKTIYTPGPLVDVYLLPKYNQTNIDMLSMPKEASLGVLAPKSDLFSFSTFLRENTFSSYNNKPIGLKWNGLLKITDSATYVFALEIITKKHVADTHKPGCLSTLLIEGQQLISFLVGGPKMENNIVGVWGQHTNRVIDTSQSKTGQIKLNPGYYQTEYWTACTPMDVTKINFKLKIRGPRDRLLREVTADDFVHPG